MTLRELRKTAGLTAAAVAEKLGVTYNAVSNYEQGKRTINIQQALKLAKLYDVSTEEIIQAQLASIAISSAE